MTEEEFEREMETIRHSAALPNAAAIGETGIDTLKGGDLTRQQEALMRHISISEDTCRPLVLHVVRAGHIITRLRKQLGNTIRQPWIWHGFRGNAIQAAQFCAFANTYISFGYNFNPDAVKAINADRILAETDDTTRSIDEVVKRISQARNTYNNREHTTRDIQQACQITHTIHACSATILLVLELCGRHAGKVLEIFTK